MGATTLAAASLAMAAAGTAVSAYGSYKQGQAAKQQAAYQSAIYKQQQATAEQNARNVEYAGTQERQDIGLKAAQTIGTGRAAWGASGVALGSGSPVDWEVDTDERARADIRTSKYNSDVAAYNYRAQAAGLDQMSSLSLLSGKNAAQAGAWGAGGSLLSGAGTVAGGYYKYKYGNKTIG